MPELPEVETVRRSLIELVCGKKIIRTEVFYDKIIQNVTKEEFVNSIHNQRINDIKRIGKYLVFILDDYSIISHLRMEGKYFLRGLEQKEKHEHIIFYLENDETLRYNDTRKFGTMHLYKETNFDEILKKEPVSKLAPEPLQNAFTEDYLKQTFKNQNKPLKTVLLDQTIISGLGNIYADEVCFFARLSPYKKANELNDNEIALVKKACDEIIKKAINLGGTTIKSFVNSHHATGLFQNELLVHTKEFCPVCGDKITKTFLGGRGTYFCKNCQKVRSFCIAITGGIASGKTTVSSKIKDLGYSIISCDEIVHSLYENKKVIDKINKTFGLTSEEIDRKVLGNIVFNDQEKRKELERIIHPLVKIQIEKAKKQNQFLFVEIPLLFEARMESLFDKIICTFCDKESQIQRLCLRDNISREEAILRIDSQMDINEKKERSDYIIDTNQDIKIQLNEIINDINKLC